MKRQGTPPKEKKNNTQKRDKVLITVRYNYYTDVGTVSQGNLNNCEL